MDRLNEIRADGKLDYADYSYLADDLAELEAFRNSGLTPEKVQAWAKAEAEGRLVVLPCKVGDTIYRSDTKHCDDCLEADYCDEEGLFYDCRNFIVSDFPFELGDLNRFGKTVFLTREEAEDKLRGEK